MPVRSSISSQRRGPRASTLLAGFLLAVGAVAFAVAPALAENHHVDIKQYAYGPSSIQVSQGDTVTWTNHDSVEHDVVVTNGPAPFRSPLLGEGESWSHTFTTPGSYSYFCSVHPDMRASVTAVAAAPPSTSAPQPTPTPTPTPQEIPSATAALSPAASQSISVAPDATSRQPPRAEPSTVAPAQAPVASTPPQESTASLDPLLLVGGVSTAVVVFCLLLIASRPAQGPAGESSTADASRDASKEDEGPIDDALESARGSK